MKAWAVRLESNVPFTAYVLQGDAEDEGRTWVCLRSADSHPRVSWLGVWSRSGRPGRGDVMEVLGRIAESVRRGVRIGPFGPIFERLHDIPSWDSWGGGRPRPIMEFKPWEVTVAGLIDAGMDQLKYPEGGIEV